MTPTDQNYGPHDPDSLSSLRATVGTYNDGTTFSISDSWRNQQMANVTHRKPWCGVTCYFNRDACDVDACVARICSVHDVLMGCAKHVHFAEKEEVHNITGYAEMYELHPHFLLSTSHGWKQAPARADAFTGKTEAVMKARRKAVQKTFSSRAARRRRQKILASMASEPPCSPSPFSSVDSDMADARHSEFQDHDLSDVPSTKF